MRSSSTTRSGRCDLTGCMISCIILFPGVRTPKRAVQGEYPTDHQALTAISSTLQLAAIAAIGGHHDAARAQTPKSTSKCDDARKGREAVRAGQPHVCQFRDSESLAAALPVLDHVLGARPGRRRRLVPARVGPDHRRFPVRGDILHPLVDQESVGVALAVRRRQPPRAGDLDLIADLVWRAGRLLRVLGVAAIRRRVAQLVLGQPLELDLVVRPRHLDDPQALLGGGVGGVADVELGPLAARRVLVDHLLEILVGHPGLSDRGRTGVGPGDDALDGDVGFEELLALDPHLFHRVRAVGRRGRQVERRHRGQVELEIALVDLGFGALELVSLVTSHPEGPDQPDEQAQHGGAEAVMVRHAGGDNMAGTASQVAVRCPLVAAFIAAFLAPGTFGCDSPARVKPWRHAPDPTSEAQHAPGSPALVDAAGEPDVHASRSHTLRIHVDAEPGRLTPLVAPSVWARRITLGTIFEPLLRYVPPDAQGPGRYAPRLARSWRVLGSGLEIRIELEPDVTFHDGHALTPGDVQFTPHAGAVPP